MSLPSTSTVARPRALGYELRLDSLYLRLAIGKDTPLDIITAPLQAPAINTAQSAEDIRGDFGQIFSRSDFTGGEGLDFAHRRNQSELDPTRFWDSKHIDVSNPTPGHPAKVTLLPPTLNVETSTDVNLHLAYDGTAVIMAEGAAGNTRRSTDFTASTPTFADDGTGAAATVLDLTTLGADIYSAQGASGIRKRSGGSWASLTATAAQRVWAVKRQLLAATTADGSVLSTVNLSTGAYTTLVSLSAGLTWTDVCDAGPAILACATDGAIYAIGFDTNGAAGGTLQLKAQSSIGGTEIPYAVGWDGTFVYYATREATPLGAIGRWYRAELDGSSYTLTGAILLRQWGDQSAVLDQCPRRIIATRDAVFTGVYETGGAFLWRYDRRTTGVTRHLDLGASGLVVDMLAVSGRLFATVDGSGLHREQVGSYESSGYLISPLADFFTASEKSWAGALLDFDAIATDETIELYYTTDPTALTDPNSTSWVRAKSIRAGHDTSETVLSNVTGRYLAGMVKLYASTDLTGSPTVRSFAFRAYPSEGDVEITASVSVSDLVQRPGYRRQRVRGLGDEIYKALKGREGDACEVEVLRTGEIFRGLIEQVGVQVPALARSGAAADTAVMKFRGRRAADATTSTESSAVFGVGLFGTMLFGGEEAA